MSITTIADIPTIEDVRNASKIAKSPPTELKRLDYFDPFDIDGLTDMGLVSIQLVTLVYYLNWVEEVIDKITHATKNETFPKELLVTLTSRLKAATELRQIVRGDVEVLARSETGKDCSSATLIAVANSRRLMAELPREDIPSQPVSPTLH